MSSERDKYRNPSPPLDYVMKTPELVIKDHDSDGENSEIFRLIDMLIDSGICDEPDVSKYEHFAINSSSDEEEIIEVPLSPKKVEVIDIVDDNRNSESNKDICLTIKQEQTSPKLSTNAGTSEHVITDKNSVSPEHKKALIKAESECHMNESVAPDKTDVKQGEVIKRKHSKKTTLGNHRDRRKHKKKVEFERDDSSDNDSHSKSHHKKKDSYGRSKHKRRFKSRSDSGSRSRSGYKKRASDISDSDSLSRNNKKRASYSSDSDSHSKNQHQKRASYSSDSDSHSRSRHKKRESYSSDSDSHSRSHHKKRESYSSDSDSHSGSRHENRASYSSGSDSHSRSRFKKGNSCSSDSDSHNKRCHKKKDKYRSDPRKKLERNDGDSKLPGETSECELFSKKEDSDSNSYKIKSNSSKSDYRIVRIDGKHQTSYPSTQKEETKSEPTDQDKKDSDFLFGDYPCNICKISMNNRNMYNNHIKGQKHKKAVENLQKDKQIGTPPLFPTVAQGKYPQPPPGYRRVKVESISLIQTNLESNTLIPYPGLDKVTEIRGVHETSYYCSFCDTHCSYSCIIPHLNGFKHQLSCLKYYRNDLYQKWSYKPKHLVEQDIRRVLKAEEERHGKDLVKVEKDLKETDIGKSEYESINRRYYDEPSTSSQFQDNNLTDMFKNYSQPDPEKSGFFCKICQSHCNSEAMWQAHIVGKRHITNLKKNPGAAPSKCKYIPAGNVRPFLFDILNDSNVDSPVIGLSQIREIRKPKVGGVAFHCFLCGGNLTSMDIVDHILSSKHRERYLASINHPKMQTLENCLISESARASILEEIAAEVEEEEGGGKPDVCYSKGHM